MDDLEFIIERKILKIGNTLLNTRSEDLKKYDLTPVQAVITGNIVKLITEKCKPLTRLLLP